MLERETWTTLARFPTAPALARCWMAVVVAIAWAATSAPATASYWDYLEDARKTIFELEIRVDELRAEVATAEAGLDPATAGLPNPSAWESERRAAGSSRSCGPSACTTYKDTISGGPDPWTRCCLVDEAL